MNTTTIMTTLKSRKLAGHKITLATGRRYLASRPFASRGRKFYDVSITDITDGCGMPGEGSKIIEGLTYDQANRLLKSFNNGETSFEGREW
jgi:hypothetical protein